MRERERLTKWFEDTGIGLTVEATASSSHSLLEKKKVLRLEFSDDGVFELQDVERVVTILRTAAKWLHETSLLPRPGGGFVRSTL